MKKHRNLGPGSIVVDSLDVWRPRRDPLGRVVGPVFYHELNLPNYPLTLDVTWDVSQHRCSLASGAELRSGVVDALDVPPHEPSASRPIDRLQFGECEGRVFHKVVPIPWSSALDALIGGDLGSDGAAETDA